MVEHLLAKEGVEGSNPFFRSNVPLTEIDPRLADNPQGLGSSSDAVPLIPHKL